MNPLSFGFREATCYCGAELACELPPDDSELGPAGSLLFKVHLEAGPISTTWGILQNRRFCPR